MRLKYFSLLLLTVFTFGLKAQSTLNDSVKAAPVFRAEAGYGQSLRLGNNISSTPFYSIHIGGNVEVALQNNLGIETGLHYNFGMGNKTQYYGNSYTNADSTIMYNTLDTVKYSYTNHSLSIPVHITYTLPIFWGLKLFAYAGPNFIIGLSEPTTVNSSKELNGIMSGSYDAYSNKISRFDIQLGAGGGIQWKYLRVRSGYNWGLFNLNRENSSAVRQKGWNVSLEYEF